MTTQPTLKILAAALLLTACAQTQDKSAALKIQPQQEVQHGYEQAKAQYELGRYYHGQLRYQQAIEAYRQALVIDPGRVEVLNAMGAAYAENDNLPAARAQFEAALKLQPKSSSLNSNLGFSHYLAGNYPAAVTAYKQALLLDAHNEKARQNLLLVYDRMGLGEQIAHTQTPVIARTSDKRIMQKDRQAAWVKVSPAVYEIQSMVVSEPAVVSVASKQKTNIATKIVALTPARAIRSKHAGTENPNPLLLMGVEVSNGNGIRGMAAAMARYFSGKGIQQARLTNHRPFGERRTRIEYRPGNLAEAVRINKLLPSAAPQLASSNLRPGIQVRLVLGHDLRHAIAALGEQPAAELVATGLTGMELSRL